MGYYLLFTCLGLWSEVPEDWEGHLGPSLLQVGHISCHHTARSDEWM